MLLIKEHRQEGAGHNRSRGKGRPVEEGAWQEVAILPKQNPLLTPYSHRFSPSFLKYQAPTE